MNSSLVRSARPTSFAAVVALTLAAGCVAPPGAALLTKMSGPVAIGSGGPLPEHPKRGEARSHVTLGLFAYGDASIETAMKNGGVSRVHHVDYEYKTILGLFSEFTTIVVGE